jgi:hypothetical protein
MPGTAQQRDRWIKPLSPSTLTWARREQMLNASGGSLAFWLLRGGRSACVVLESAAGR